MNPSKAKKYLKPDAIWLSGWKVTNHHDFIKNMVPEIQLRKEVHEDVVKEIEIIKCLLVQSYYKYQFFDVALNNAVQVMEMSFKIRYKEITGIEWGKGKNLEKLIKELDSLNLFESHISHINNMRSLRNSLLHPDRHSFAGSVFSSRIVAVVQIINELYDDVSLRKKRKAITNDLQNFITNNLSTEIEIIQDNKRRHVHTLQILLIDNKERNFIYYIAAVPVFSLEQYNEKNDKGKLVPQALYLELTDFTCANGAITGFDNKSKSETVIRRIEDANEIGKYKEWKAEQERLNKIYLIDHSWHFNVGINYFYLLEQFLLK